MKHSQEEIITALNVIKETCIEQNACDECPFRIDNVCKIKEHAPNIWNINVVDK